ncbi:MAG: sialidase family protein [Planctomycetota bacterium]|nr:sialidase family protein [Planctomycetota bacterium]
MSNVLRPLVKLTIATLLLAALMSAGPTLAGTEFSFDDDAQLKAWKMPSGKWSIKNETLLQSDGRLDSSIAWLSKPAYTDLDISVEFFVQPGKTGVLAAGLVFHGIDEKNYYLLHFDTRNKNVLWVRINPDGRGKDVRRHKCPQLSPGRWHTARLVVKGLVHKLYLDGKLFSTDSDDALPAGYVGLRTAQGQVSFRNFSVSGNEVDAGKKLVIQPPKYGIVCSDAGAGAYEAFPDVCRTRSGELLCVFYAGYAHASPPRDKLPKGARIAICRSKDDGLTWSAAETVVDTPIDDRDSSIIELPSGDLLVTFMNFDLKRTKGTHQAYSVRSSDGGKTWSQPKPIDTPFAQLEAISTPPRLMPDGRLLLTPYGNNTGDPRSYKHAAVLESRDEGRTWTTLAEIKSAKHLLLEPDLVRLPQGRLLMMMRAVMTSSESTDGGHTWTDPKPVGIAGDCPYLLLTSKNILLCGIRQRSTRSTCVLHSTDFGRTWKSPVTIDPVLGAYPSMVELPDGRIFVVYYNEGGGSDVRYVYLDVDKDGVRILPRKL